MPDSFDDPFRIYFSQGASADAGLGSAHRRQDDGSAIFSRLVNNALEDMKKMGMLHASLHESNELIKAARDAATIGNLRNQLIDDLHCLLDLAKQINKKFDSLVAANAARRCGGAGSSDDQARASMIADLAENIKLMMRDFQGFRVQMEIDHRQIIENRYFAITGEKATAEAIDNLIANKGGEGSDLYEAVEEIQVRRETMVEVRSNLMGLHQIFLGIATPVEAENQRLQLQPQRGSFRGAAPSLPVYAPGTAAGGLNDYERETRRQAQIAIAIAVFVMFFVILALNYQERMFESEDQDLDMR